MTRDEMKNKISLALKDPLLQQGFEVICKENAVLKDKIGMLDLFCGGDSFKQRRLDTFIQIANYIEKLEKENAELEAQIEKMKCCGNCQKLRGRFDSKTNINILYCSDSDMKQIEVGFQMCCCKWEIKK